MSLNSSFATAISGLDANGTSLSIVSDNIVNANTTGFKCSRGEFQTVLANDLLHSGTGAQAGRGVMLQNITPLFSQGSITRTERSTDLAVNGNGFFLVKGDNTGQTYTRDGSFRFDKNGWLTNMNDLRVQAYQASPEGKITGTLGDIRIPFKTIPAKPTNKVEMHLNLDARLPVTPPLDVTHPEETAQFTTATSIFDSVGNTHSVSLYFNKTGDANWEWYAMSDGADLLGGNKGQQTPIARGLMTFDPEGKLSTSSQETLNTTFANGAIPDQKLEFNFGDPLDKLGTGERGTTQYGSKSGAFRNVQDGWGAGTLADTAIDSDGLITGLYTNGQNKLLGQIALARFEGTERLAKLGQNQFRETIDSGQPLIGIADTNGRGQIMTKSLESSNVDIAKEFVDMIKAQRGFQSSAKSITTANEMLDELMKIRS